MRRSIDLRQIISLIYVTSLTFNVGQFHYFYRDMFSLLKQKIEEHIQLTPEEFNWVTAQFQPKKLRKKQYLLQEGDVCRYAVFVEKGLLRSYTIDKKGNEHILQFALEGWWLSDLYSFFTLEPSIYTMDALEDCELLMLSRPNWDTLLEKMPKMERFFRILIQNNLIATQRRLMKTFSETAETKYQNLVETFPECFNRVPQHMIASYLGITRETLSRIRSNIARRQTGKSIL